MTRCFIAQPVDAGIITTRDNDRSLSGVLVFRNSNPNVNAMEAVLSEAGHAVSNLTAVYTQLGMYQLMNLG